MGTLKSIRYGQRQLHRMNFILNTLPKLKRGSTVRCTWDTCFNATRCDPDNLLIYLYEEYNGKEVVNDSLVREQQYYRNHTIPYLEQSKYITDDPEKACLFLPTVSLRHSPWENLPFWNNGTNHLFFVWHQQEYLGLDHVDNAIIAKSSWRSRQRITECILG